MLGKQECRCEVEEGKGTAPRGPERMELEIDGDSSALLLASCFLLLAASNHLQHAPRGVGVGVGVGVEAV